MPFQPTGFQRFLKPLDRRSVDRAVDRHHGNRGVGRGSGAWTCQRHLKALLFAQVTGLKSLREIEQALDGRRTSFYHLDLCTPHRTTLSDASSKRPAAVFRDICTDLMAQVSRGLRREGDAIIRLLDATPIQLRSFGFDWAESDPHTTGLKLHFVYDPRGQKPMALEMTSPRVNDVMVARDLPIEPGSTCVFDKGYTDYDWWHRLEAGGAIFVTRLKRNAKVRLIAELPVTGDAIVSDRRVRIGNKMPRGGKVNPLHEVDLRIIEVERANHPPLRLLTNDHTRTALEIANLYKERWQIELFFKWIKQNLKVKSFLGRSENAVKIQLYIAIIAFLLFRLMKEDNLYAPEQSMTAIRTRLKVASLTAVAPLRRPPQKQLAPDQLELRFQFR